MKRLLGLLMIGLLLVGCGSNMNTHDDAFDSVEATAEETSSIVVEASTDSIEEASSDIEVSVSEVVVESEKLSIELDRTIEVTLTNQQYGAGLLTAGRWNDNVNFEYFMEVLRDNNWYNMQSHWKFEDFNRYTFEVNDTNGRPVVGAKIILESEQGQNEKVAITDNKGKAVIYPNMNSSKKIDHATIEYNNQVFEILDLDEEDYKVTIDVDLKTNNDVDIMFVVDTTGSMSDELEYLKVELQDVIERVKKENSNQLDIRMSGNYYRDNGDKYVVRSFDFTSNIDKVIEQMSNQVADGGGDYEEAVVEALDDGIYKHKWRESARAKLLFLVLDAPPHHTNDNIEAIHTLMDEATEMGIKIIPIASSGVDKETEFLLRFMALDTGGEYIFLTDHSGVGNSHITPTIGYYEVEQLNDMLVDIINQYVE